MTASFFPPRPTATPTIYSSASTYLDHAGLLTVGYTERIGLRSSFLYKSVPSADAMRMRRLPHQAHGVKQQSYSHKSKESRR